MTYLSGVAEAGTHDNSFVVEFLVVIVDFGDANDARVILGSVTLGFRVGDEPIQNPKVKK